ncbi:MAG: sel1 repeat family protein [Mesoflavibacter sp.]|nr:sel1 repeat family protein [Mesoflavibacter sp.]
MNIKELEKKAEAGDADAQYRLGLEYKAGDNIKPSDKDALYWFTKAADQGNADAKYKAGLIHFCGGLGVKTNKIIGFRFWIEAAEQGHEGAQKQLDYYSFDWDLKELIKTIKENIILDKAAEAAMFAQQNKDDLQENLKNLEKII